MRISMKTRLLLPLALMLAMGALLFPVSANALVDLDMEAYIEALEQVIIEQPIPKPVPVPEIVDTQPPNVFTPDGTGTVVDNLTDDDGKEFFSIQTEDGNVFYLIVDRQRYTENVYLLNAVTENDLMSLAKPGDGKPVRETEAPAAEPEPVPVVEPDPPPAPEKKNSGNATLIFIVIAVVAVGGAGYYFKIVRPKQNGGYDYDDEGFDDDVEADMDDYDDEDMSDED